MIFDKLFCGELRSLLRSHIEKCEDCQRSLAMVERELPFIGMLKKTLLTKARDDGAKKEK